MINVVHRSTTHLFVLAVLQLWWFSKLQLLATSFFEPIAVIWNPHKLAGGKFLN